mgnify:CR=1 FL=1
MYTLQPQYNPTTWDTRHTTHTQIQPPTDTDTPGVASAERLLNLGPSRAAAQAGPPPQAGGRGHR